MRKVHDDHEVRDVRYRKVAIKMWGDEAFNERLTPQRPSGQTLWIYLLIGPHTTNVPGLAQAGEAALAERLHWPLTAFRRAWAEVAAADMARADWRHGVIWLPRALDYNAPANPNVVVAWRDPVALVPPCPLKSQALDTLRLHCQGRGPKFLQAFDRAFGPRPVQPYVEQWAERSAKQ